MSQKPSKSIEGDEKTVIEQTLSSSDPLVIKSSKGKPIIIIKVENLTDVERETEAETVDLRAFKDRPIEYLQEASQREYEVEGDEDEIELEYDEMTESDVEREVQKLKIEQKAHFKEVKDLLTVQVRLKGKVPTMSHLIQTYIKGRFPGIPSDIVEQHAEIEKPEKQDLHKMRKEKAETLITEHDRRIPRRQAVVKPGRRGVTMSIDPYDDVEIYEVDIEDKIVKVITLTDTPKKEDTSFQKTNASVAQSSFPVASTSKEEKVVVTDILSENIAKEYVMDKDEDDNEHDETMSISSTSTADYDRDEMEDLVEKIASCHAALAQHYADINKVVLHMLKTQLATYLGKIPIVPLVKLEGGPVMKTYNPQEATDDEHLFRVAGDTWEDKLKYLTERVPAKKLVFAIAIGDLQLNQTSQAKISQKYGFPKTRIQQAMSADPAHKKGGGQYQAEKQKKRKVTEKVEKTEEIPTKKMCTQPEIPLEVLLQDPDNQLLDIPIDDDDEDLPDIQID